VTLCVAGDQYTQQQPCTTTSGQVRGTTPRALQIRTNSVITPHHSIFTGRTLFLTPYQQCQSTEGKLAVNRGWRGSRVVSVLDSGAEGPGFKSQSRRCRVTVLGKLFTLIVPLLNSSQLNESTQLRDAFIGHVRQRIDGLQRN